MSEQFKDTPTTSQEAINDRLAPVAEQVPHSGTLPGELREAPVRDFDNTTLPEAYAQGRIVTPDTPALLVGHPTSTETASKKRRTGLWVGAGAAGVALAVGAVLGLNKMNEAPEAVPTAAAPADPSEAAPTPEATITPEAVPVTVESLEIPAGLDAETLGKTLVGDRFSAWANAGASAELRMDRLEANQSWDAFLPTVVEQNKAVFAEALFVPGWQQDDKLVSFVDGSGRANLSILSAYVGTAWNSDEVPANKEGYRQWEEVQSVTEVPDADPNDNTRTLDVTVVTKDNAKNNTVTSPLNGSATTYTVTVEQIDGKEKISKVSLR